VPDKLVPLLVKGTVVAPPLAWLTTLVSVPSPAGRVSENVAAVAVAGPALEMTTL